MANQPDKELIPEKLAKYYADGGEIGGYAEWMKKHLVDQPAVPTL